VLSSTLLPGLESLATLLQHSDPGRSPQAGIKRSGIKDSKAQCCSQSMVGCEPSLAQLWACGFKLPTPESSTRSFRTKPVGQQPSGIGLPNVQRLMPPSGMASRLVASSPAGSPHLDYGRPGASWRGRAILYEKPVHAECERDWAETVLTPGRVLSPREKAVNKNRHALAAIPLAGRKVRICLDGGDRTHEPGLRTDWPAPTRAARPSRVRGVWAPPAIAPDGLGLTQDEGWSRKERHHTSANPHSRSSSMVPGDLRGRSGRADLLRLISLALRT